MIGVRVVLVALTTGAVVGVFGLGGYWLMRWLRWMDEEDWKRET